jgi:hypothetical protein
MSLPKIFAPSDKNITYANATVQQLDLLVVKRKTWESTVYKKASEGLHGLLAEAQLIYETKFQGAKSDDDRRTIRQEIALRLITDGVKVQKNSTTLTMFVRYIFGSDRKRAHGYQYVIKAAISHGVRSDQLAKFIVDSGGIEEIKRKMVVSEDALKKQTVRAKALEAVKQEAEMAETNPLASINLDISSNKTAYSILIVKPDTAGKAKVIAVLKSAEESLILALYKRIAKSKVLQDEEAELLVHEMSTLTSGKAANDTNVNKVLEA